MKKITISILLIFLAGYFFTAFAKKKSKFKTLNYLTGISGSKTVAGIHNREPNSSPSKWTDKVYSVTGKFPGVWSGDFLFQEENINNRSLMIHEALRQWEKGAIVNIMWHSCNPAMSEPCGWDSKGVKSKLTDEQWAELEFEKNPIQQIKAIHNAPNIVTLDKMPGWN